MKSIMSAIFFMIVIGSFHSASNGFELNCQGYERQTNNKPIIVNCASSAEVVKVLEFAWMTLRSAKSPLEDTCWQGLTEAKRVAGILQGESMVNAANVFFLRCNMGLKLLPQEGEYLSPRTAYFKVSECRLDEIGEIKNKKFVKVNQNIPKKYMRFEYGNKEGTIYYGFQDGLVIKSKDHQYDRTLFSNPGLLFDRFSVGNDNFFHEEPPFVEGSRANDKVGTVRIVLVGFDNVVGGDKYIGRGTCRTVLQRSPY